MIICLIIIKNGVFSKLTIKKVYATYLDMLDGSKRFLLEDEVNFLSAYELKLDDHIREGSFEFLDMSIELINNGHERSKKLIEDILSKPMSFDKNESVNYDYDNIPYAKTTLQTHSSKAESDLLSLDFKRPRALGSYPSGLRGEGVYYHMVKYINSSRCELPLTLGRETNLQQ